MQISLNRIVDWTMTKSGELADDYEVRRFPGAADAETATQRDHPQAACIHPTGVDGRRTP